MTAWELYHAMFKDGEDIVLIDEDDVVWQGRIVRVDDSTITIKTPIGKEKAYKWLSVRFMSHDGFPVKKLFGADGSRLIEKLDTGDVQKLLRDTLTPVMCVDCDRLLKNPTNYRCGERYVRESRELYPLHQCGYCQARESRYRFGDPFDITEPVESVLLFAGNDGEEYWDEDGQEVLVMRARDGAMAQLYEIKTVYFAEVAA